MANDATKKVDDVAPDGGLRLPEGIDEVVGLLPSCIPAAIFSDDEVPTTSRAAVAKDALTIPAPPQVPAATPRASGARMKAVRPPQAPRVPRAPQRPQPPQPPALPQARAVPKSSGQILAAKPAPAPPVSLSVESEPETSAAPIPSSFPSSERKLVIELRAEPSAAEAAPVIAAPVIAAPVIAAPVEVAAVEIAPTIAAQVEVAMLAALATAAPVDVAPAIAPPVDDALLAALAVADSDDVAAASPETDDDDDAAPELAAELPISRRSPVGVVVLVMIVLGGAYGAYWFRSHSARQGIATPRTSAPPLSAAAEIPSPEPALDPSESSAEAPSAPSSSLPAGMGLLKTEGAPPGRRIFVDQRAVEQTPASAIVKCGPRLVKIGSTGQPKMVDVPCGGEASASW